MPVQVVCRCGCSQAQGAAIHRVMTALAEDDMDRALEAGLLTEHACGSCSPGCITALLASRESRNAALAARDRFRAREIRLARRQHERLARKTGTLEGGDTKRPSLPPAAAAALARAKAKAAGRTHE